MNTSSTQLITGAIITILGIGFLLDNFGIVELDGLFATWWPLILVVGGLASLAVNYRQPITPLIFVVVGVLLQLRALEILHFDVWGVLWPTIIIGVGLSLLFRQAGFDSKKADTKQINDITAFMSGASSRSTAIDYQGGKVTAILGGVELDLRDATLKQDAVIDMFVLCGGVELRVPDEWEVVVSGVPILGGWEEKTRKPSSKNPHTLTINATCIIGGIEVKN